jgi:hypothetical protein
MQYVDLRGVGGGGITEDVSKTVELHNHQTKSISKFEVQFFFFCRLEIVDSLFEVRPCNSEHDARKVDSFKSM